MIGAEYKTKVKEAQEKRRHDRHVFERMLRKENELERRRRKNRTFGAIDDTGTLDSIETISEDSEEQK